MNEVQVVVFVLLAPLDAVLPVSGDVPEWDWTPGHHAGLTVVSAVVRGGFVVWKGILLLRCQLYDVVVIISAVAAVAIVAVVVAGSPGLGTVESVSDEPPDLHHH